MKKHYPWLWFDADDTLFDYQKAEDTALFKTLEAYDLPFEESHHALYREINQGLWQALERKEIQPEVLRVRRFELFLEAVGRPIEKAEAMSASYIERLALCADLIDGALEVLEALQPRCRFGLITNGLAVVQNSRLALSPLKKFFSPVVISEEVGFAKPAVEFFNAAHERAGFPPRREILVIGDSLTSDMQGGINFSVDTCWFNPQGKPANLPITYQIQTLRELLELLD
ncbi:MAG: YjjG family noncanonical pyrimidine nucleotidase [Anaerolineales bacterium]|nr:YjjG family noncanonical pyrimidine nucleotidase [Anaerolineales bacterium]